MMFVVECLSPLALEGWLHVQLFLAVTWEPDSTSYSKAHKLCVLSQLFSHKPSSLFSFSSPDHFLVNNKEMDLYILFIGLSFGETLLVGFSARGSPFQHASGDGSF